MKTLMWFALPAMALAGLHRLAMWAEDRGYIYYRKRTGTSGALANAVLETQALLEPSKRYILEERARDQGEGQETGDPPGGSGAAPRT